MVHILTGDRYFSWLRWALHVGPELQNELLADGFQTAHDCVGSIPGSVPAPDRSGEDVPFLVEIRRLCAPGIAEQSILGVGPTFQLAGNPDGLLVPADAQKYSVQNAQNLTTAFVDSGSVFSLTLDTNCLDVGNTTRRGVKPWQRFQFESGISAGPHHRRMKNPWMGGNNPQAEKRPTVDPVGVERLYKGWSSTQEMHTAFDALSDSMGNMLLVYPCCNHREATPLRASQHQPWEVRDPRERCFGHKKPACSGPSRLSIVVYRRSWREVFLPNTSDFREQLKSGKGRPMEKVSRMGNPLEQRAG